MLLDAKGEGVVEIYFMLIASVSITYSFFLFWGEIIRIISDKLRDSLCSEDQDNV